MSEIAIFYSLVSANAKGKLAPYKGISVDILRVSADNFVADFRDSVWKKNRNTLAGFDSAQLKVFLNIAVCTDYLAEITADPHLETSDIKNSPLKSGLSISGFGKTEEDHLVLLVPENEQGMHYCSFDTREYWTLEAVFVLTMQNPFLQ